MVKKNTCVFISGNGTNLKNLIKKSRDYNFPISIKLVISNKKDAIGVKYAKKNSIPIFIINSKLSNYENLILQVLKKKSKFYLPSRFYENFISKILK